MLLKLFLKAKHKVLLYILFLFVFSSILTRYHYCLTLQFHRLGNRDLDKLSNLPEVTRWVIGVAGIQSLIFLTPVPIFLSYIDLWTQCPCISPIPFMSLVTVFLTTHDVRIHLLHWSSYSHLLWESKLFMKEIAKAS